MIYVITPDITMTPVSLGDVISYAPFPDGCIIHTRTGNIHCLNKFIDDVKHPQVGDIVKSIRSLEDSDVTVH